MSLRGWGNMWRLHCPEEKTASHMLEVMQRLLREGYGGYKSSRQREQACKGGGHNEAPLNCQSFRTCGSQTAAR